MQHRAITRVSKILIVVFIITKLLLSHINLAFWSIHPIRSYSVHFSSFSPIRSTFRPIQSTFIIFGPFCLRWSYSVLFSSFCSICSILSTLVLFDFIYFSSVHFSPIRSIRSTLVLFSLLWSIMSTLVLFCLFCPLRSYSGRF